MSLNPKAEATPTPPEIQLDTLRKENEYKTRLLNSVAHEIATPLTPVRIQLLMLHEALWESLTPAQRRSWDLIERNVDRLQSLVQDVLDVTRLESARFPVRMEEASLQGLVAEAVDAYREAARRTGIELTYDEGPSMRVLADTRRFVQVVQNLLSNALKFTQSGGKINVSISKSGPDGVVTVVDTGVGFDRKDEGKLFKPFSQLDANVTDAFKGAGLGLYISQGIAELHGGKVTAASPGVGKGATFRLVVPLSTAGPGGPAVTSAAAGKSKEDDFARRVRRLI